MLTALKLQLNALIGRKQIGPCDMQIKGGGAVGARHISTIFVSQVVSISFAFGWLWTERMANVW
jgi:hypothetical protein